MAELESPDKLTADLNEAAAALVRLCDGHRLARAPLDAIKVIRQITGALEAVTAFAEKAVMAAEAERETCAKVAEGFKQNRNWVPGSLYDTLRREVATAIRARSNGGAGG